MKHLLYSLTILTLLFCTIGCSSSKKMATEDPLLTKANMLAQKYIITDGHVDLPYRLKVQNFRLEKEYIGIPIETEKGDFDYKRAKAGGLDAPFMSIYIPARYQVDGGAADLADSLIDMVVYIADQNDDYFGIAKTPQDVVNLKKEGKIALPMGMETEHR